VVQGDDILFDDGRQVGAHFGFATGIFNYNPGAFRMPFSARFRIDLAVGQGWISRKVLIMRCSEWKEVKRLARWSLYGVFLSYIRLETALNWVPDVGQRVFMQCLQYRCCTIDLAGDVLKPAYHRPEQPFSYLR
jgi:hypothetical protein